MIKERALLKQIQQFLICECEDTYNFASDIEELLAQPEQEPIGYLLGETIIFYKEEGAIPLYTSPPKRARLSNEDIAMLWGDPHSGSTQMIRNFVRAIEDHWSK